MNWFIRMVYLGLLWRKFANTFSFDDELLYHALHTNSTSTSERCDYCEELRQSKIVNSHLNASLWAYSFLAILLELWPDRQIHTRNVQRGSDFILANLISDTIPDMLLLHKEGIVFSWRQSENTQTSQAYDEHRNGCSDRHNSLAKYQAQQYQCWLFKPLSLLLLHSTKHNQPNRERSLCIHWLQNHEINRWIQ